jgi:hypothetical protein
MGYYWDKVQAKKAELARQKASAKASSSANNGSGSGSAKKAKK